jgi:hypothetical protein
MNRTVTLVRQLSELSKQLKRAAVWNGSRLHVDATAQPYMYELLCFFHVALQAHASFGLRIVGAAPMPNGKKKAKWPRAPGHKSNHSYISLINGKGGAEAFQLCPGIKVLDQYKTHRAPDVSLLAAGTPATPQYPHLLGCWDAKYTSRAGSSLPGPQIADFIVTYRSLGEPQMPASWKSKVSSTWCKRSGVLTNAVQSGENDAFLKANKVGETSLFPQQPIVRP